MDRPELEDLLRTQLTGEILTVWRLDRLVRDLHDLLAVVAELGERGVAFRSLRDRLARQPPPDGSCSQSSPPSPSSNVN